jgi:PAS domain S-box-containing protein
MPEEKRTIDPEEVAALRLAFEAFTETTAKLEQSYQQLQERVRLLDSELARKNRELTDNLEEKQTIQNHLNYILEAMNIGIVVINMDEEITIFNDAAAQLTGLLPHEAIGKKYEYVMGPITNLDASALDTLRSGTPMESVNRDLKLGAHRSLPLECNTALVKNDDGDILGAVETLTDLTQVRKLEGEVRQAQTLAALGEMAANIAHEIRNPLGGIGGFAALLERDLEVGDPRRDLVKKIIQGVKSLNRIASNLLFYTRPLRPRYRPVDLPPLLDEVLGLVEMELEQAMRPIEMVRDFSMDSQIVSLDPELLQQVLLNLLKNAAESMYEKGTLTVGLIINDGGDAVIRITDTGCGIEKEALAKLFNPFFTTKTDGTGLGLAIVKKIVDIHDGTLDVESEPGAGTTFIMTLPPGEE